METKKVKDLMLPLSEYAVVTESATLWEALKALEAAQKNLSPGKFLHRAVLVANKDGEIVGKLGHHGFLEALEPKYTIFRDVSRLANAGLTEDFIATIMDNYRFWQDSMEDVCRRARTVKIGQVMKPVEASIEESKPLIEAIHALIVWQTLSLLVTREGRVVGILRLSDLFREIASYITSAECKPQ
jgi:CBS domain-containing protein